MLHWKSCFKFSFVLLCTVTAWIRLAKKEGSLWLPCALTLSLCADYYFLFTYDYINAVAAFCGVQLCYSLILKRSPIRFLTTGILGTGILALSLHLLGISLDAQSLTAFFYIVSLFGNMAISFKNHNRWLFLGLLLLLFGDINVAVYNLRNYLPVKDFLWYQLWWELSTPLIWSCYLPGQLLFVLKMPEICRPYLFRDSGL